MNAKTLVLVAALAAALATMALAKAAAQRNATNPGHDLHRKSQQLDFDPNPTIKVLMHQDYGDADLW